MTKYIVTMQAPNGSLRTEGFTANDEIDLRSQVLTCYPHYVLISFHPSIQMTDGEISADATYQAFKAIGKAK